MEKYDVIVVGAGPAGSLAAKEAAKAGAHVLMIEKKKEIGAPVRCGEGLGNHWLSSFGMELSEKCISTHIKGALIASPDLKSEIVLCNERTKGVVFERKVLDKELAMEAARAGAEIIIKSEVTNVVKENGKVTGVIVESGGRRVEYLSKVLIAADGSESTIARMAGLNSLSTLYDTDFGVEYEMVNVECRGLIEVYFGNVHAPRGYGWVFPKGKDVANVGIGVGGTAKGHAIDYLNKFLKIDRFKDAQPVALKAGLIPVGAPMKDLVLDGFIVAGTAAHQVDPIHGGGIGLAAEAGAMAGQVAGKCIISGNCSAECLSEYERIWREKREAKLLKRLKLRKVLEKLNDKDLNVLIGAIDDTDIEKVLRSNFAPVVKKLLFKRPQLLKVLHVLLK
ncbi:MAG: NAD(P)/FAD-dependent oxidoreductase [Candidatus Micrarchaeota archaeon]